MCLFADVSGRNVYDNCCAEHVEACRNKKMNPEIIRGGFFCKGGGLAVSHNERQEWGGLVTPVPPSPFLHLQ